MKKAFVLIALLFALTFPVCGQYLSPIRCVYDSLVAVGAVRRNDPEQTISLYFSMAQLLSDSLPERSLGYIIKGYRLAVAEKDREAKGRARQMLGNYYSKKRRFGPALENYLGALQVFRAGNDTLGQAEALSSIAMIHQLMDKYADAERMLLHATMLARLKTADQLTAEYLTRLGAVCILQKKVDTALLCYHQAEQIYIACGDNVGELTVRNHLAGFYMDAKDYPKALALLFGIMADSIAIPSSLLGTVITRIGHCYSEAGDNRGSLKMNKLALSVRNRSMKEEDICNSLINISGDYLRMQKPDSAWIFLKQGIDKATRNEWWWMLDNAYRHLFNYYYSRNDFVNALSYAQKRAEMQKKSMLENNSINLHFIRTGQRYSSMLSSNALLEKINKMQQLNIGMQSVQSAVVEIITLLAAISMVVLLFQYLYSGRLRRNMQLLNEKLNMEILERNEAQRMTLAQEEQFRFIMSNSLDVISRIGRDFIHSFISPSSKEVIGYPPEEMGQLKPAEIIHPDYRSHAREKLKEMIRTHKPVGLTYPVRRKDGEYRWVESILNPVFNHKTGGYLELVAVTRDIQDRKTKEKEMTEGTKQKENLLKEIHHRVKNNFAILVSLINMQKGQTTNAEIIQSLTNLQLRIRSMSLVHEMLYRSADFERISFTDYLQSLASVIAGTYSRRDVELKIESDPAVISIETSIPLGLIVNEVLSNAYKHAFPEGSPGVIRIQLINSPGTDNLTLIFSDNGIGLPEGFQIESCPTMGLQIVNILVSQIEGALTISKGPGTTISLTFPNKIC